MEPNFHRNNRRRLGELLPPGSAALFFSGDVHRRTNDVFYDFEPDKNFYYLTGLDREDMALALVKEEAGFSELLFLPPVEEQYEKWRGVRLREHEALAQSGCAAAEDITQLLPWLHSLCAPGKAVQRLYLYFGPATPGEAPDAPRRLARELSGAFPQLSVENCAPYMTTLRYQKQPEEIEAIRSAAGLVATGLAKVRALLAPGLREYELRAAYEACVAATGAACYGTVCAAGANALCLHHNRQTGVLQKGELFLIDVGAPSGGYWADVSRTYPVSGCADKRQAEVYRVVLEAQQQAIAAARPGVLEQELNELVKGVYARELHRLGLITHADEVERYYYHNIGHPLGLDVHDLRPEPRVLCENAVYTVEPGLYIAEWGIGIRIEDDILLRKGGCEVLTAAIPKLPAQVGF